MKFEVNKVYTNNTFTVTLVARFVGAELDIDLNYVVVFKAVNDTSLYRAGETIIHRVISMEWEYTNWTEIKGYDTPLYKLLNE
jgi:hypothetical protein